MAFSLIAALALASDPAPGSDVGPLVRALWLVQRYGTAEAVDPSHDQRVKGAIFKALGKDGELTLSEVGGLMAPETFNKLAGADHRIPPEEITHAVQAAVPESRLRLLPKVREYADSLTTSFDMIDEGIGWRVGSWRTGSPRVTGLALPLDVIVVCTGNSRRSILGATMGNVAAAYYGMPEIRFHSGGTAPTAFNSRTVNALKAIGVELERTGKEAARGEPKTANPVYRIRWGRRVTRAGRRWRRPSFPSVMTIRQIPKAALRPSWSVARLTPGARSSRDRPCGCRCRTSIPRFTTAEHTKRRNTPSGVTTSAG